jgi:hypothetical protein
LQVLSQLEAQMRGLAPFGRTFRTSALKGMGIGSLRQFLLAKVGGHWGG